MTKSNIIFLSNVRLSFPHLIDPQRQLNTQTGAERISYNCEFIMPHDHPGYQEFMAQFGILAADKWKEHAQNVIAMIQQDRKTRCFGAGHEKINKKTFQPYDGYSGMVYLTAGRETPPQMIQASGAPIDPTDTLAYQTLARGLYGGCRVNAAVKPWLQDNKHGRAIRCDLVAIQFLADDTPFGEVEADITGMFPGVQPQMPTAPFPSFMTAR